MRALLIAAAALAALLLVVLSCASMAPEIPARPQDLEDPTTDDPLIAELVSRGSGWDGIAAGIVILEAQCKQLDRVVETQSRRSRGLLPVVVVAGMFEAGFVSWIVGLLVRRRRSAQVAR